MPSQIIDYKQYIKDRTTYNEQTQCWEWNKAIHPTGYGHINIPFNGKQFYKPHRLVFALYHHMPTLFVCHKCDNKRCCNPDHLFEGTAADNNLDKKNKGRSVSMKGEKNGRAVITEQDVRDIRARTESQKKIGLMYGLSQAAISSIKTRQNWSHVD